MQAFSLPLMRWTDVPGMLSKSRWQTAFFYRERGKFLRLKYDTNVRFRTLVDKHYSQIGVYFLYKQSYGYMAFRASCFCLMRFLYWNYRTREFYL